RSFHLSADHMGGTGESGKAPKIRCALFHANRSREAHQATWRSIRPGADAETNTALRLHGSAGRWTAAEALVVAAPSQQVRSGSRKELAGIRGEARSHAYARAGGAIDERGSAKRRASICHSEASGESSPLRLALGNAGRPAFLGCAERSTDQAARGAARDARGRSSARIRKLRGHDPAGQL